MGRQLVLDVNAIVSVVAQLNVGVYVTDLDRRIILWNPKAEEITGYSADEVVGKALDRFVEKVPYLEREAAKRIVTAVARESERESNGPVTCSVTEQRK